MIAMLTHPVILPIALALASGALCLLMPRILGAVAGWCAVIASGLVLWYTWPLFTAGFITYDFHGLHFKVDMLSRFVALAIAGFGFLISLYSTGYMKGKERRGEYYAYVLWSVGASLGIVFANELVLLLIGWGFLGFLLYMLVGIAGPQAAPAAKKSLIIIGGSDAILILGIAIYWKLCGTTHLGHAPLALASGAAVVSLVAFVIAAFAKAGAMPLHSWVPDCGQYGPASVAAFLPASLDKLLGIYLLARIATDLFVLTPLCYQILMFIGAGTIVCAVMMALVQHDMKRLLSYHAVSQVGYMVLGIGTGTVLGLAGALFHMLNHTIYKSCLFLSAGSVERQAGTTDLDRLGGLARVMPFTFLACSIAALSISGIPPFNGFASKWLIYQGVINTGTQGGMLWVVWLVAAMLGSALTLASFVKVLHAVFLCKMDPVLSAKRPVESSWTMVVPMMVLATACVTFGVFAFSVPLKHAILPAVPAVVYSGTFWAGPTSIMLLLAAALGVIIYLLSTVRSARTTSTYIGGEILSRTYISGEPDAASRNIEVSGVDFYRTIQQLPVIGRIYAGAEKKWFDPYVVGSNIVLFFTGFLRGAYTGSLPVYLGWVMAGILAICAYMFLGGVRW